MDLSLFLKHKKTLDIQEKEKVRVQMLISEAAGITLPLEQITVTSKKITLTISSVKKMSIHRAHIQDVLARDGYILSY